jgi:hypothetical protein
MMVNLSLGNSIKILSQLQKYCSTAESMALQQKNTVKLTMAAANGIFNISLYKVQFASRNAQINEEVLENNLKLKIKCNH